MAKTCKRAQKTDIAGQGRAEAMHCTRASIYTELPVNCLSFWVMQSAQPKLPRTHFQGHPWRGFEEGDTWCGGTEDAESDL